MKPVAEQQTDRGKSSRKSKETEKAGKHNPKKSRERPASGKMPAGRRKVPARKK